MFLFLLYLPFSAHADIQEPDPSSWSLTPLSATTIYVGESGNPEAFIRIRINSPGYTINDDTYLDYIDYTNDYKVGIRVTDLKDNVLTLSVSLYGGTDESSSVSITIAGQTFPAIPVRICKMTMNKNSLILAKGKSKTLKVNCGSDSLSGKTVWKSSNPKVASVSKSGKVKAKKSGNTLITADIDGQKVGCVVSVGTKKKIAAVNMVKKIVKTSKYSQSKRMKSGYYDCSSLMWKAYRKNGCNFGNSSHAPTAADQAKYMAKKKKLLGKCTEKKIKSLYYQVGDVCYHSGSPNGRFKNIYHTEMFIGYRYYGLDDEGNPIVSMDSMRSHIGVGDLMARP